MKNPETLLHYLDVLLKESNFTKAAQELFISQPYLTQLIKRIEKKLGTTIIDRQQIPFTLTKAGSIYYKYLEKEIVDKENLNRQLLPIIQPNTEVIRIGILESLGSFLLAQLLPDFLDKNPNINIQLKETSPRNNETNLLNEQIDCYIGQNPESINQEFDLHINGSEKYFIIISPKSKYFKRGKFILESDEYDLQELLQEPFVVSNSNSAIRHQLDAIFHRFNVKPNLVLESNSIITVTNLAIKGVGLTISAASIIKRMAQTPINLLPLDPNLINIRYFIATKAKRPQTPGITKLINSFNELEIKPKIK
ncbi:LysR family transcriptional regulator [Lactobacillus sp. ESL0684]|uniref:LysR family transcriptional regulator n=1 Tax=Lactobacillus sp. ESL0684 TaxID=2983213 RepID=UPI0023F7FE42|nr:LysR family transcriptional regulator [Lactobacillus sp. ESL0684]WEV43702.1 LysR family transcriptional regulator [Lactobacillus sp. ESL0684]